MATSPVEYAVQYQRLAKDNNLFEVLLGGTIYGTMRTAMRILAGAYDVATFLLPYPRDYRAIMEPENAIQAFQQLQ